VRYKLLIFDFDGTLADSYPWFESVFNDVATRYGLRRVHESEREALRALDSRAFLATLGVPRWKLPLIARHMRALKTGSLDQIELFPGVDSMLHQLVASGVTLAIVSSDTEANIRQVLGPTSALFAHYACSASLFGKRPKIRKVLRDARVKPYEALCIGDEIRDLEAARAMGVAFAAVTWGFARGDALAARGPDMLFTAVEDIAQRVARA
jgi:phosphoglycolate phosphatase